MRPVLPHSACLSHGDVGDGKHDPVIMTVNSFVLISPEILARATVNVTVATAGQNRGTRPRPWDWRFLSGFWHIPDFLDHARRRAWFWTSRRKSGDSQQGPSPPANLAGWQESDGGRGGSYPAGSQRPPFTRNSQRTSGAVTSHFADCRCRGRRGPGKARKDASKRSCRELWAVDLGPMVSLSRRGN